MALPLDSLAVGAKVCRQLLGSGLGLLVSWNDLWELLRPVSQAGLRSSGD